MKRPSWRRASLTGLALGMAELAKTTLIVFYPLWPLIWIIYGSRSCHSRAAREWLRQAAMLSTSLGVGLYVLNVGYGFEGSFRQLKDFHFVSKLLTGVHGTHIQTKEFNDRL